MHDPLNTTGKAIFSFLYPFLIIISILLFSHIAFPYLSCVLPVVFSLVPFFLFLEWIETEFTLYALALLGVLYQPRMTTTTMMVTLGECGVIAEREFGRKKSPENLLQCHFGHHKSHLT
jgi:hypothetical protein